MNRLTGDPYGRRTWKGFLAMWREALARRRDPPGNERTWAGYWLAAFGGRTRKAAT